MAALTGINIATSSGNSASTTFVTPSSSQDYYFIAIIPTPT
jgi:hypothetical protein